MTEKNNNFLQKQENEGTREKMLDFQAVQAGYQKIEPVKEDAIEFKLMSAQEQELSPEFMRIKKCESEFDCRQILEPQPVQEQHRASESQSIQEEEHMANANQEQGESAQSSQNRNQETEFGPVHEQSMLYAQEEKKTTKWIS